MTPNRWLENEEKKMIGKSVVAAYTLWRRMEADQKMLRLAHG
jgi:hypothetical protein